MIIYREKDEINKMIQSNIIQYPVNYKNYHLLTKLLDESSTENRNSESYLNKINGVLNKLFIPIKSNLIPLFLKRNTNAHTIDLKLRHNEIGDLKNLSLYRYEKIKTLIKNDYLGIIDTNFLEITNIVKLFGINLLDV